jgi:glycerophosphoryl diester phosphodiesterase
MYGRQMPNFLAGPHPRAFAHRGGDEVAPENTLEAFRSADELGYQYLETDVHLTKDGEVVAFHDDTLDRVTDSVGMIADLPWSAINKARVDDKYRIPLLEELLEEFPRSFFNIDPKEDRVVDPLASLLQTRNEAGRVCVGSFSDRRLAELSSRLGPELCTALGPRQIAKLSAVARGLPAGQIQGNCAQVPVQVRGRRLVDRRFVDAAQQRNIEVHVWTVNDADEMHRLLDLGVDGIMSDKPAVLKDVLLARGQWHSWNTVHSKTHRDPE